MFLERPLLSTRRDEFEAREDALKTTSHNTRAKNRQINFLLSGLNRPKGFKEVRFTKLNVPSVNKLKKRYESNWDTCRQKKSRIVERHSFFLQCHSFDQITQNEVVLLRATWHKQPATPVIPTCRKKTRLNFSTGSDVTFVVTRREWCNREAANAL